jgi:polyhydroxyalkanoate synthesis regulator phasin
MISEKSNNFKTIIPIITVGISVISFLTTLAIKPIVNLSSRVEILEQRVDNRKNDIKNLYYMLDKIDTRITNNNKQLYAAIGELKERIARMEGENIKNCKQST